MSQDRLSDPGTVPFTVGQIVWAKVTGYPWWPAKITQLSASSTIGQQQYRVDFLNDHSQYTGHHPAPICRNTNSSTTATAIRTCQSPSRKPCAEQSNWPTNPSMLPPHCQALRCLQTPFPTNQYNCNLPPHYKRTPHYQADVPPTIPFARTSTILLTLKQHKSSTPTKQPTQI